jgi:chlorobactene glucosyltransferase
VVGAVLVRLGQLRGSLKSLPEQPVPSGGPAESVSVIVPVRNERLNLGRCVHALVSQHPTAAGFEVVVVDDASSDGTLALAKAIAADAPAVRVLEAGELPLGWTGKAHACWRGAQVAHGDWLCFVDADTWARPALVSSALAYAQRMGVDIVTLQPYQELVSFWERLILPQGFFVTSQVIDFRAVNDPASSRGAANGQFVLVRREAYFSVDGHAGDPDAILEDFSLANRLKARGARLAFLDGGALIHTRMYRSLGQIIEGLSKNSGLLIAGPSPWRMGLAALAIALFAIASLVVPAFGGWMWAQTGDPVLAGAALAASLASGAMWAVQALVHVGVLRIPILYALIWPLGCLLCAALLANSLWRAVSGRNVWRGRVLPAPRP